MEWREQVALRIRRKNNILFRPNDGCFFPLRTLLAEQSRETVVLWAFDFAAEIVAKLKRRYPAEHRPAEALMLAERWASGSVKMQEARYAILACHAFAKNLSSEQDVALCHAVGQACSVVHTPKHALGLPVYELTAIVRGSGGKWEEAVELRIREYESKLLFYKEQGGVSGRPWAKFLCSEQRKERIER